MSDSNHRVTTEDAAERALRDGLCSPALSAEALLRIRRATKAEWRATVPLTGPRRYARFATVASLTMLSVAIAWIAFGLVTGTEAGAVLGKVTRSDSPGIFEARRLRSDLPLSRGAEVHVGQLLDFRGDSLVTLVGGGNLRVARASAIEIIAVNTVRLERGVLYVDIPPGSRGDEVFVIVTGAGEFRHVGTQFAVAIVDGMTRLRVREGSVQWQAAAGVSTVSAGTEMIIEAGRAVTRRPILTVGRDWAWAEALAPEFEIENRPLKEFLDWFSRETGRKLVFTDGAVRKELAEIRMHGSVHGLTAIEALSAVMGATALSFDLPENSIRVSSAREKVPST